MGRIGYNPKNGKLKTDVDRVTIDRAFLAHFQVSAADAVANSNDGVHAGIIQSPGAVSLSVNLINPAVPRALRIKGNVSGIAGNVVITGTNYAGAAITETIALNGSSVVEGAKAFKTVTNVLLPAQTHTPANQTETIEITHECDSAGDITMTITSAQLTAPKAVVVALVTDDDTVTKVADKIVEALNADEDVSEVFTADNLAGVITLTSISKLANDGTLAFGFVDTDTTLVTAGSSTNGVTGVPYDIVSVGWNDKLGLPYLLTHNTVIATYLNNVLEAAPTVVTDVDEIEKNTVDLSSALNGGAVDIYLIV